MQRMFLLVLLAIAVSAYSWPPRPSAPSPAQSAAQPAGDTAGLGLPRVGVPEAPAVPRVSPPSVSVPRVSAGRGGLL